MYTFFEKSHLKKCGADVLDCLGVSEFLYDAKTDISEYFTDDIDMLMDITTKNRIMFLVILTLACGENSYLHLFAECFALKSAKRTMQKNNINLL